MTVQIHRAARDTGGIAGQCCEYTQSKKRVHYCAYLETNFMTSRIYMRIILKAAALEQAVNK